MIFPVSADQLDTIHWLHNHPSPPDHPTRVWLEAIVAASKDGTLVVEPSAAFIARRKAGVDQYNPYIARDDKMDAWGSAVACAKAILKKF